MDKQNFLNLVNIEDKYLLSSIYDKINLADKTGKTIYTNEFYPPVVWRTVVNLTDEFDTFVSSFGVFEEAERRMLCFSREDNPFYPITLLKAAAKSNFNKTEHKDYLGALMALGVKREKFGDLMIADDYCYIPVCDDIKDYVISNLNAIGKTPCRVYEVSVEEGHCIEPEYQDVFLNVSSLRLDSIVGAMSNLSRSKAAELISEGKVLVNYLSVIDKNKSIKNDSVITIRGYGKYKIVKELGLTQKGRVKLQVKRYR